MSSPVGMSHGPASVSASSLIALERKSRGLSLKSKEISATRMGAWHSAFRGRGMEYDESRPYQSGDDIRSIDWRVTARTGKAHTKLFREEREKPVHLWIDFRAAMFFATRGKFKSVIAAELASLFAWVVCRRGDRVGGILFADDLHYELKPRRGKTAVLRLIRHLVHYPGWRRTGHGKPDQKRLLHSFLNLRQLVRPGSMVILLSDFRGFDEQARSQIIRLRQHNELLMVHIYDRLETSLPPAGHYRITDGETDLTFDSHDKKRVQDYRQRFHDHREQLLNMARTFHIHYMDCRTEDDPITVINQFQQR